MPERILIRGVNWIGDAVMTLPALRALKRAAPDDYHVLLVKPSVAPIFDRNPSVDEVILYEDRYRTAWGRFVLAWRLRKGNFSQSVLLQNAFDAALVAFLAGIPGRIGYDRDGRGFLLTKAIPSDREDRKLHHVDYYLDVLRAMGIPAERSEPWIALSPEERMAARETLSALPRPILGINPGAAFGSAKRWPAERFGEVARWFIEETGGSAVVFGGPNEEDIAHEIDTVVRNRRRTPTEVGLAGGYYPLLNLAGKTGLRQLIALLSECDILVTNDSGPMHLAYAVGTPIVAVFGSTDPKLTGYEDARSIVLKSDFSCSPCFERTCRTGDLKCMHAVESDEVYLALKGLLAERRAVFFDRDGTLCRDVGYLNRLDDLELFPTVAGLSALKEEGFSLIGVSNQSGIGRGIVDETVVQAVHRVFLERYGFDDFLYCPHRPEEHCACRKPEPGMLISARARHRIDLKASFVVGDKDADMLLAKAVGATAILVRTGSQMASPYADFTVDSLNDVVNVIRSCTRHAQRR